MTYISQLQLGASVMFPQSWSPCSLRPKFKRRRLSQIPTPRVDIWFPPV